MQTIWKIILIGSILFNILAIWSFFHYIKYGGSPLGELKRILTGTTRQKSPPIPYAEENAQLMASGPDSLRVVFFGASITRRWDLPKYFPEIHPVNRGIGGQFAPDMMPRFKRDVLDLKPRAAVIKFCSINIRPQIPISVLKDELAMMVQLARQDGIIPIVTTIIPAAKSEARIGDFSVVDTLAAYNQWVRDFAASNSLPLIDYAAAISDSEGLLPRDCSSDPIHLNEKGYDIITKAARPVINRTLAIGD